MGVFLVVLETIVGLLWCYVWAGTSLRAGVWGFLLATMNVTPLATFKGKKKKNKTKSQCFLVDHSVIAPTCNTKRLPR